MIWPARKRSRYNPAIMPKITSSLLATALLFPAFLACRAELPGSGEPVDFRLTILHSNDANSQLLDSTANPGFGGAAHFVQLVRNARQEAKQDGDASLLLSAGNNIFVNPQFQVSLDRGYPYLDSKVLSAARFDAVCLANHELAFASAVPANFARAVTPRSTPFLVANVSVGQDPKLGPLSRQGRIARGTILHKHGVKIGVVGVTTPLQGFTLVTGEIGVSLNLPGEVQKEVSKLKRRGADIVILLSNLSDLSRQKKLIRNVRGLDVVVAGGSADILANEGDLLIPGAQPAGKYPLTVRDKEDREVLLVSTGGSYLYLGRLVLGFTADGEVAAIDHAKSGPLRVGHSSKRNGVGEAQDVANQVIAPLKKGLEKMERQNIARVQGSLDGILRHIRSRETNLGDLVADSILKAGRDSARSVDTERPDVAIINGGAIENNSVVRDSITAMGVFTILPFPDFVTIVEKVPPSQIKEVLENGVSQVENFEGRFPQVSGLRYTFTTRGRAQEIDENGRITVKGTRILEVQLNDGRYLVRNGNVVGNGPAVSVATVDFAAFGGDQYPFYGRRIQSIGVPYQDAFSKYVEKLGTIREADYPGVGRITRQD